MEVKELNDIFKLPVEDFRVLTPTELRHGLTEYNKLMKAVKSSVINIPCGIDSVELLRDLFNIK